MKTLKCTFIFILAVFSSSLFYAQEMKDQINIIPKPKSIVVNEGSFKLNTSTKIFYEKSAQNIAVYLNEILNDIVDYELQTSEWDGKVKDNSIIFSITNKADDYKKEGYTLAVNKNNVMMEASELNGLFYAVQTLRQIVLPDSDSMTDLNLIKLKIPSVVILDNPEFSWRGLNLDCCRHFMSIDFIKRYIDLLAYHKMNVFHWHLTEDQAWRIEIKKYPELTNKGAWRTYDDGSVYGGFYSQEDIKEVVAYAESRFITVVPEIEMPGHSTAAIACYPEISCTGGPFEVGTFWGIYYDIYCAGNEKTFQFLEDVISEVVELFPSKYIHIGGDEAPKERWENCPKCNERIKTENLKDAHELQSYFIKRMEKFINSKGKQIIGWDEILEGGLAPNATVQSWRGIKGAIDAAKQGHDVIVSPTSHCYFDYPIDVTDMQKVYFFDPVPAELTADERKHVLGSEANMWTEYAPQELVDDRLFPRLLALSEVVWSYPAERNFEEFRLRVQKHYDNLDLLKVNYGLETKPFSISFQFDKANNSFKVDLHQLQEGITVKRITMQDGKINAVPLKWNEFSISESGTLNLQAFRNDKIVGKMFSKGITFNKATGKEVKLTYPFSEKFSAGGVNALTDGLRGSDSFRGGDKSWQGYQGTDFDAVIDLGEMTDVNKIAIGFFQASSSWVVYPEYVQFYISDDGKTYQQVERIEHKSSLRNADWSQKDFTSLLQNSKARYIKIFAKNLEALPSYHPEAGGKPWLMIDEIIVE